MKPSSRGLRRKRSEEKMKMQKKQISITLDEAVLKEVRNLAVEADRSLSGYINYVLKMHAEKARRSETAE